MTGAAPVVVRVMRRFDFAPERVFDAFLDPAKARRFLFATPAGEMVRAEIDPRVGGAFRFVDRRNGEDVAHVGEYLMIDRPRRLVFAFSVPKVSPDVSRVTIEIAAEDGGCRLTLTQELRPEWAHAKDQVAHGWTMILDGLAATLSAVPRGD